MEHKMVDHPTASTRRAFQRDMKGPTLLVLGPLFVALSGLAFLFPLSGDDWSWGSSDGIGRLHDGFAGYNGRYLGNLSVLVLTRTHWLTPFVVSATLCLLIWLVARIAAVPSPTGVLIAGALVLAMPLGQWRQTVVWVSGFSNYALASIGLLLFVLSMQRDWEPPAKRRAPSRLELGALLLVAFASQLFVEHVTLLITGASLVNLVVRWRLRERGVTAVALVWAIGSVAGATVMFSNTAYRTILTGGTTYQGVGAPDGGGLGSIVHQASGPVSQYAQTGNALLNFTFFALIVVLALRSRIDSGRWTPGVLAPVTLAAIGVAGGAAITASIEPMHYGSTVTNLSWLPALAQLAALLVAAQTLVSDSRRRRDLLALVLSTGALVAPMVVISPFGPRNFLPGYLLLSAAALVLFAEVHQRLSGTSAESVAAPAGPRLLRQVAATAAGVVVIVTLCQYFVVYQVIHQKVEHRVGHFSEAARDGKTRVHDKTLPFPEYVHAPDPTPGIWARRYKRYYGLPSDLRIILKDRYANTEITGDGLGGEPSRIS